MTEPNTPRWESDTAYEEATITKVEGSAEKGWNITRSDGWGFFHPPHPVAPKEGETARFFGRGIGYPVRGLVVAGREVFYRTEADNEAYLKVELYGATCEEVLERWDSGRGIWSVVCGGFGPSYEQTLQITAMEILRALTTLRPAASHFEEQAAWDDLRQKVGDIVNPIIDPLGISGMQWGAAMRLAARFYLDGPVACIESVPSERRIQCSKNFPSLEPPATIVITLQGGIVTAVGCTRALPGAKVTIIDYDAEGMEADRLFAVDQGDGEFDLAIVESRDLDWSGDVARFYAHDDETMPEGAAEEFRQHGAHGDGQ